jgi:hypothetical protein
VGEIGPEDFDELESEEVAMFINRSPRGCPRITSVAKLVRMQSQCPVKSYRGANSRHADPKLNTYRQRFLVAFAEVKKRYGYGFYSYAEGMTRRNARKIARNIARKSMAMAAAQ